MQRCCSAVQDVNGTKGAEIDLTLEVEWSKEIKGLAACPFHSVLETHKTCGNKATSIHSPYTGNCCVNTALHCLPSKTLNVVSTAENVVSHLTGYSSVIYRGPNLWADY